MKKIDLNVVLLVSYVGFIVSLTVYNMIKYGFSNCSI
jgi:hypothetical protein